MEDKPDTAPQDDILKLAVDIVSAYVSRNPLPATQIPDLIQTTYQSLSEDFMWVYRAVAS